jgi:hypothetical protein
VPWERVVIKSGDRDRDMAQRWYPVAQAKSGNMEFFYVHVSLSSKVALEQDLSIATIFRRKKYLDVPLILSSGQNGM